MAADPGDDPLVVGGGLRVTNCELEFGPEHFGPIRAEQALEGDEAEGAEVVDVVAGTLAELGTEHAFVVHGAGKLDEISLAGPTMVAEVRRSTVRKYHVMPEDFGKQATALGALRGGNPLENAELIQGMFAGAPDRAEDRARHDIVVINASAALVAAGIADDFRAGAALAEEAIRGGAAAAKLQELRRFGQD